MTSCAVYFRVKCICSILYHDETSASLAFVGRGSTNVGAVLLEYRVCDPPPPLQDQAADYFGGPCRTHLCLPQLDIASAVPTQQPAQLPSSTPAAFPTARQGRQRAALCRSCALHAFLCILVHSTAFWYTVVFRNTTSVDGKSKTFADLSCISWCNCVPTRVLVRRYAHSDTQYIGVWVSWCVGSEPALKCPKFIGWRCRSWTGALARTFKLYDEIRCAIEALFHFQKK